MTNGFRILIVDEVHPILMQILDSKGIEYQYKPEWTRKEAQASIREFQCLVLRSKFRVDRTFLQNATHLKLIGRAGAGLDNIDLEAAKERGIAVFHAAKGNSAAVAEHTIGMILMLLNKLGAADLSVRNGSWDREAFRGTELGSKTVGLLGYGNMGQAVAKRLQSFGCEIIAYDKYLEDFPDSYARKVSLQVFQEKTQILSLHIPLTSETQNMVGQNFLAGFQKLDFLVNTSRGQIVPTADLLKLLETGFLKGAALDVLADEPPPTEGEKISPIYQTLFRRSDVILSPHVAGWSLESYEKISVVLGNTLIQLIDELKN